MSAGPDTLWVRAPAKVNLFLEVLGRRGNGYHDIRSILVPVSLYDVLRLECTDGEIVTVVESEPAAGGGPGGFGGQLAAVPSGENLATRAARALKAATGHAGGVRIQLRKRIPVGGGMGGGSADAAAVLVGLNRLWDSGLTQEQLTKLGADTGCDVPAMVCGGAVCMEGLGERVRPLPVAQGKEWPGWWLVLLNPGFGIATRDIYARCTLSLTSAEERFRKANLALKEGNVEAGAEALFNGLQATVVRKYPLLGLLLEHLKRAGAIGTLVSGSGSSVFGLARDEAHARSVAEGFRRTFDFPVWQAVVRTLPDGVMVAHGPLEA